MRALTLVLAAIGAVDVGCAAVVSVLAFRAGLHHCAAHTPPPAPAAPAAVCVPIVMFHCPACGTVEMPAPELTATPATSQEFAAIDLEYRTRHDLDTHLDTAAGGPR